MINERGNWLSLRTGRDPVLETTQSLPCKGSGPLKYMYTVTYLFLSFFPIIEKVSCSNKSWHENYMHINFILMHENEIFMHENEDFAPKIFMGKNSMHDILHSPITHEHFWGYKIPFSCMGISYFHAWKFRVFFIHKYWRKI